MKVLLFKWKIIINRNLTLHDHCLHFLFLFFFFLLLGNLSWKSLRRWIFLLGRFFGGLLFWDILCLLWCWLNWLWGLAFVFDYWLFSNLDFINRYAGFRCNSCRSSTGRYFNSGLFLFFQSLDCDFLFVFFKAFLNLDNNLCFDFFGANGFAFFKFFGLLFLFDQLSFGGFFAFGSLLNVFSFCLL